MTQLPFGGIGRGVNNAARGAVGGVDRLISAVEGLAEGIISIEREMKGMRRDMREVIDSVEGLRHDLRGSTTSGPPPPRWTARSRRCTRAWTA